MKLLDGGIGDDGAARTTEQPSSGSVSARCTVDYKLEALDYIRFLLTSTIHYEFEQKVPVDRFVIIATCDPVLRDAITACSRWPLFEIWFIGDDQLFRDSVHQMLSSASIAMHYIVGYGLPGDAEASSVPLIDVEPEYWVDYLTVFDPSPNAGSRQDVSDHFGRLRIFECDLAAIAGSQRGLSAVEHLSLRSTIILRTDEAFCYWHAPFQCLVDRIRIDVSHLKPLTSGPDDRFSFHLLPLTSGPTFGPSTWNDGVELRDIEVNHWFLAGQGFVLLWKDKAVDKAIDAEGLDNN